MSEKEISNKMQEIMSRMKSRREELDMSYQTLSDKVGISKSTLQRYETGSIKNMPVDKLEDIAAALNVSPAYLMGWNESSAPAATIELYNVHCETKNEVDLVLSCRKLSEHNQRKVLTYSKSLLSTQQMEEDVLAAHARTDVEQTPEGVQHDLDIMNDDSEWE